MKENKKTGGGDYAIDNSCFAVKIARSYLHLFCRNTLASQTDDRETTSCDESEVLQIAMQLQSSAKKICRLTNRYGTYLLAYDS